MQTLLCLLMLCACPAFAAPTTILVHPSRPLAVVPAGLYSVGYNGWGDILSEQGVKHLQDVRTRFCRIDLNLKEMCGDRLGDFRWEYTTPCDLGVGFASRVRRIIGNGWTPMIALSIPRQMPAWFQGEADDANAKPWYNFNLDGTPATVLPLPPGEGRGEGAVVSDQWSELTRVTQGLASGLAAQGLTGLHWETIYEIGHTMPMADIHYFVAKGIREADPTAKLIGPATWPGWTVEERFLKPYLAKYGPDLLDFVSVHWYADNEHGLWAAPGWKDRKGPVTMADRLFVQYLMETAPKYAEWCKGLRKLLDDPQLNPEWPPRTGETPVPRGNPIGIIFSEFDCLAESPYQRNPENADWPNYRADADCYLNTNWFGGVWCAAVLCGMAQSGSIDIACKFNTRQFYGLIDNSPISVGQAAGLSAAGTGFFRQPVWFAWKLLQEAGGLVPGAQLVETEVDGPRDQAQEHVAGQDSPWVMATAVRAGAGVRLILINRSLDAQPVSVAFGEAPGARRFVRTLYSEERLARFIGRKPGTQTEGSFEGAPDDFLNARCLEPLDEVMTGDGAPPLQLPPVSITVLRPAEESAPPR